MTQQDTINRQIYGRLFQGPLDNLAKATQSDLIGSIFDKTYMPALLIDAGKQSFNAFTLAQNTSFAVPLPPDYDVTRPMYVAIQSNLKARVVFVSPTLGTGTVLLNATDDETNGEHYAFFTYQGDLTSLTVSVPQTSEGGDTTTFKVFMYEIPDLTDFQSYYDKQIGLGYSNGDE